MTNTETRIPTVHVAEVEPYRTLGGTWFHTPDCRNDITKIRLFSKHQGHTCTWSVIFTPDGDSESDRPVAHLIPNASVISAHRVPGDNPATVELVEGDIVVIQTVAFRIDDRYGRSGRNPELVLITD
ncbi:MAG: hypothetical protein WC054_00080 [Candidatus Nanopelagicales bacterium]